MAVKRGRRFVTAAVIVGALGAGSGFAAVELRQNGAPEPLPAQAAARPSASGAPTPSAQTTAAEAEPSASVRVPAHAASPKAPPANATLEEFSACSTGASVTFAATYATDFDYHHVFIDADGDARTGYVIPEIGGGFGADYLIEDDYLFRSTGPGWAWQEIKGVSALVAVSGGAYQWEVRPGYGGVRAVFNGSDGAEVEVYSPVVRVGSC